MSPSTHLRRLLALGAALGLLAGCSWLDETDDPSATTLPPPPTLAQPADPGDPGTLLSAEPVPSPPPGTVAWRIAYASRTAARGSRGGDRPAHRARGDAATGRVAARDVGPPHHGDQRPVRALLGGPEQVHLVPDLADVGVAVVATDYEGLGTEGGHPYLVGASEGRAVLDAARAARAVPDGGVEAGGPVVVAGFSQGGHAALWAAQLAPTDAPELDIRGVLAAAPVTDVAAFVRRSEDWPEQFGVLVTIAYGMAQAYPELDLADILTPEGLDRLWALEDQCIAGVVIVYTDPIDELLVASPRLAPGWRDRLAENMAAQQALGVPVLILQGADDPIVDPALTREAVARLCGAGDTVEYREVAGVDHAILSPERAVPWILDRLAGAPATSTCGAP